MEGRIIVTTLKQVYRTLYDGNESTKEADFLWRLLYDEIAKYIDPKYARDDIEEHLFNILEPLCQSLEVDAFKRGISLVMRLTAETFCTPGKTYNEAEHEWQSRTL